MYHGLNNSEIASTLREMASYYLMDDIPWKPQAYTRAADAIASMDFQLSFLFANGGRKALLAVPGIGPAIAEHIELLLHGHPFPELASYRKKYPVHLLELTSVEHVGPKTVKLLYEKLRVRDLEDLERAARAGKLHTLPGFGAKSESRILKAVEQLRHASGRKFLGDVLPLARRIEAIMRAVPGVKHAVIAGSLRRMQETIGDIDLLVTTSKPLVAVKAFRALPEVASIDEEGRTKITARLTNGMRADLRVIPEASFGAALQYFTGDKNHNVEVRKIAIERGYKLNEYGLWRGTKNIACKTEEEIYAKLGLPCLPPELRVDGTTQMDSRLRGNDGLGYGDVRGDLQVQTNWTDGRASIEQMATEAQRLGREYIAITDHSQALVFAHGLDAARLAEQGKEIDEINAKLRNSGSPITRARVSGMTVLKGIECDILKNGKMDLSDATLASLDIVGASIHSSFTLSRAAQTKRIITALKNPHVDILFHPTARRIGRREEMDADWDLIFKAVAATHTALEINASDRMDLRDAMIRRALRYGVKFMINSDSHSLEQLHSLELGIAQARRGWATKSDIINTRPLVEFLAWLATPKAKRT